MSRCTHRGTLLRSSNPGRISRDRRLTEDVQNGFRGWSPKSAPVLDPEHFLLRSRLWPMTDTL